MKIQLMGAARTVTGSCYIIECAGGRFAVDCGMHQGNEEIEKRNSNPEGYRAKELDFILLTHAHIDHSGLLPRMAKEGFNGPVYCTEPTLDLLKIMLLDSAHIQEMEAEWANRKRARRGGDPTEALYTTEDALAATACLQATRYNESFEPAPGVRVRFRDAGHILGSSFLELEIKENGDDVTRLVFSGDLGRPNSLIVNDPATPSTDERIDYLFMESTYGDRNHKPETDSLQELADAVHYSYSKGQKTIIPAFAVERTQEVLFTLHLLIKQGRIPANIPVYVDSPLAIRATEIFRNHPKYFDDQAKEMFARGEDPLSLPNLTYTLSTSQSQAINEADGPGIVISASGMCNAGRIKHHLRHNLWRKGAGIVFVGYQGVGTPGRKLVDGAKKITLLGEEIAVEAKIFTIGGFSGHAGQSQIVEWVGNFAHPDLTVFLVHGEEKAQNTLAELLRETYTMPVYIPGYEQVLEPQPGKAAARVPIVQLDEKQRVRPVVWAPLLASAEHNIEQLRLALERASNLPWADQVELRDQLLDLNKRFMQLLSEV